MRSKLLSLVLALRGAAEPGQPPVPSADSHCTRALLEEVTDRYNAAQSTGRIEWLQRLMAPNVTYLENEKSIDLSSPNSTLRRALRIDRTHSFYDVTQCATFTETIVSNPADPWVIAAQIRLTDGKISKIDRIATTTGDWQFNATRTLHYAILDNWGVIPAAVRDTRDTLQGAADAYFNMLGNHSLPVPWGYPCRRLEGGAITGTGAANDTCFIDIPANTTMKAPNRRYVIDEVVGAVSMMLEFGAFSNAPDSHAFRIESGKLKRIHAFTYCETKPNCGFDPSQVPPMEPDPGF
ncbi:hypothetical protein GQ53DRAFT_449691 [Thozetella sp. PMI_491]|nr:hypothetical protein GQ53DRAFT_449691 [Thozetella sp. PMI_491]